jgi:DNA-binding MarR family transcriptional regulator
MMNRPNSAIHDDQALRLATAVSRLRGVLRDARWQVTDLSITQVALMRYLEKEGLATASDLAAAERISPQAVAQQLHGLKERGFVEGRPDESDRRKTLLSLTEAGSGLLDALLETREAWLARAIESAVPPDELADLDRAIEVLERLASAVTSRDFSTAT